MKTLEQKRIEDLNELLASEFKVPVCPIKWTGTRRGRFVFHQWLGWHELRLGRRCWRGLDNSLVHEFAHYLCFINGERAKRMSHKEDFYRRLKQVVQVYFADIKKYAWNTEYSSIQNKYKKESI